MPFGRPARAVTVGLAVAIASVGCSGGDRSASRTPAPPSSVPPSVATSTTAVGAPVSFDTALAVAAGLAAIETALRDPTTAEDDLPGLGRAQQSAYRVLTARPEWHTEVLALLPAELRPVVDANVAAGREIAALNGPVRTGAPLPRWRIVAPEPAAQLMALYREAGSAVGVPWPELAAIHFVETRMGRIQGDSVAGAQGPMQFIPSTWAVYGRGGDIRSTRDSVFAAARLLRAKGAPADMGRALYAYNPSRRYVRAISAYADQIRSNDRAYLGYHGWQVYYGDRLLAEGTVVDE